MQDGSSSSGKDHVLLVTEKAFSLYLCLDEVIFFQELLYIQSWILSWTFQHKTLTLLRN